MPYAITNQDDLRESFWRDHPTISRRRIPSHSGTCRMYETDTRCAFVDYVDSLCRDGTISQALAQRATL